MGRAPVILEQEAIHEPSGDEIGFIIIVAQGISTRNPS